MSESRGYFSDRNLIVQVQRIGIPVLLVILIVSLLIYGFNSYQTNREQRLGERVHTLINEFDSITFEEDSLAYGEELNRLAEEFRLVYEESPGADNGKRALYHAGMTEYLQGDFSKAEETLAMLVAADAGFYLSSQAFYFRALALEELERYEDALDLLDMYDSLYGGGSYLDKEVILARARNYAWLGDLPRAEELYGSLIIESENTLAEEEGAVPTGDDLDQTYSEKARELLDLLKVTSTISKSAS